MRDLDELRHDVEAKLLVPLPWSPLQDVDFNDVPTDGREHELTLYMEDTMWPYEDKFVEYIDRCGEVYSKSLDRPNPLLTIEAAFQPALGSHLRREVALMQRIHDPTGTAQTASDRDSARAPRPGNMDARRARAARPVDQPAAADVLVVTPVSEPRMNIGTIIDAAAADDPGRAALIIDGRDISYGELADGRRAVRRSPCRQRSGGQARRRRRRRKPAVDRDDARRRADRRCGGTDEPRPDTAGVRGLLANAECAPVGVAGETYVDRLADAGACPRYWLAHRS